VLDAIRSSVEQFGYAPTLGELATQFGYTSHSTVHEHLKNLERKGWIIRRFNAERGITLVDPDAPVALDALRTAGDAEVRE
jgi:repressor LexA